MIDESLNNTACAVTLEQAELALQANFESYATELPPDLMASLEALAEPAPSASPLAGRDGEEPVLQVYIDPLWKLSMDYWMACIRKRDDYLLAVFNKFDADRDGAHAGRERALRSGQEQDPSAPTQRRPSAR